MKAFYLAISLVVAIAATSLAWASCTTHTIFLPDGRTRICQVCCDSQGNCTTACF